MVVSPRRFSPLVTERPMHASASKKKMMCACSCPYSLVHTVPITLEVWLAFDPLMVWPFEEDNVMLNQSAR
jgi:hypothetical protein